MTTDSSQRDTLPEAEEEARGGKASPAGTTTGAEQKGKRDEDDDDPDVAGRSGWETPEDAGAEEEAEGTASSEDEALSPGDGEPAAKGATSERASTESQLRRATDLKEEGNAHLKESLYDMAIGKYKKGLQKVKRAAEEGVEEAGALQRALQLNLSMAYLKNEQFFEASKTATQVLEKDPSNVKALFRRGQAQSRVGMLEGARDDFAAVLKLDANNSEASRELLRVRKKLKDDLEERKKAYSNMFEKTAGLYDDREKQMEQKRLEEEEARKKRRQEWHSEMNERQARGESEVPFDEWEREKARERDEKKRRAEKATPSNSAAASSSSSTSPPSDSSSTASSTTSSSSSSTSKDSRAERKKEDNKSDGEESDEECRKIINETKKMGYCYFRKDLTDEEKRLKEENKPQRIDADDGPGASSSSRDAAVVPNRNATGTPPTIITDSASRSPPPSSAAAAAASANSGQSFSSWNSRGTTYEEKDMTPWAVENFRCELEKASAQYGAEDLLNPNGGREELQQLFHSLSSSLKGLETGNSTGDQMNMLNQMSKFSYQASITVAKVSGVEGEAHVAVVRGSRRFIFELSAVVAFKCAVDKSDKLAVAPWAGDEEKKDSKKTYEGELQLHDVSSAAASSPTDFLSESKVLWKGAALQAEHKAVAEDCLKKFKENVIERIQIFFEKYKKAS